MRTLEGAVEAVREWADRGAVGNLVLFKGPGSDLIGLVIEEVVKYREMEPDIQVAFEMVMETFNADRGEVFRGKDGKPDRIKFSRSIE